VKSFGTVGGLYRSDRIRRPDSSPFLGGFPEFDLFQIAQLPMMSMTSSITWRER